MHTNNDLISKVKVTVNILLGKSFPAKNFAVYCQIWKNLGIVVCHNKKVC